MPCPVKDYMDEDIPTVDSEASTLEVAKMMAERHESYFVVLRNSQLAGIVTEGDILRKVIAAERSPSEVKISEIMSSPLVTIGRDEEVSVAAKKMIDHDVRRLPVVRDSILYGVITMRDLAKHFNDYNEKVVKDIFRSMSLFHV